MGFAAHIDEFSSLNHLTPRPPCAVHPSSVSFSRALPGRRIGNELVVCVDGSLWEELLALGPCN